MESEEQSRKHRIDANLEAMCWDRNSPPILVLKRDSWFVIGLSRKPAGGLLSARNKPPTKELAAFQLLGDLSMRPGRNDRLESCDCPCLLQLRVDEVYGKEREADTLVEVVKCSVQPRSDAMKLGGKHTPLTWRNHWVCSDANGKDLKLS